MLNNYMKMSIIAKIDNNILNDVQIDRIIEMAWEDRTPFDAKISISSFRSRCESFNEKRAKI